MTVTIDASKIRAIRYGGGEPVIPRGPVRLEWVSVSHQVSGVPVVQTEEIRALVFEGDAGTVVVPWREVTSLAFEA